MKKIVTLLLFFLLTLDAYSQQETHCLAGETAMLNGKVGSLKSNKFTGTKTLSLCADTKKSPVNSLTYRFGQIGKVEFEYSAPKDGLFSSTDEAISPRASVDVIYFSKGATTYAISECSGMHCGDQNIRLQVFQGKKRVALLDAEPEKFQILISISDIKGKIIKQKPTDFSFVE
jgi:hypothetical protein